MSPHGYQSNLEVEVISASPLELVIMLYEGAIQATQQAQRHMASQQDRLRAREISRAILILQELSISIDRTSGGDLAQQLVELYDYMQRRLNDANLHRSPAHLEEVADLLRTLKRGWLVVHAAEAGAKSARSVSSEAPVAQTVGNQAGHTETTFCG
jgi:flagellar protein FliS